MAILSIPYCNASLGKTITLSYDDVTHEITGSVVGGVCSPGLLNGNTIYTQPGEEYNYIITARNFAPYAQVRPERVETNCVLTIDAVDVTNASTDETSDGAVSVTATGMLGGSGPGRPINYSIDGVNWQASNVFTGLAPGIYTLLVRQEQRGDYCYATDSFTVAYDALASCDLVLGNVLTTDGPGGTLTVVDYFTGYTDQPVEYRLDAGAWQESAAFTGLAAGTYNVQIRFKNFTTCSSNRDVTLNTCDLTLDSIVVTHEQSKYGDEGSLTIYATTGSEPLQYSIDNGANYQDSNVFNGLSSGVYQVRVLDDGGCEVFASVEVLPYKKAVAVFPIANAHRIVITGGPVADSGPQNFDNTLLADMKFPARVKDCYAQPFTNADLVPLQWRSSWGAHTVKLYSDADVLIGTLTPVKRTANLNYSESVTANFSNYGAGQTQVWFPTGLPSYFEIGQDITITDQPTLNGTYEIEDIVAGTGEAEGFQAMIITAAYSSGSDPITGTVTVVYNLEEYEVWEIAIDKTALAAGKYYLIISGSDDQFEDLTAQSEPFEIVADSEELVLINYKNIDSAFLIDYTTGIEHVLRIEGELVPIEPGGEREVMEDSQRRTLKLREFVTRQVQLNIYDVPYWKVEKLKVAMAHDVLKLNGVEYQPVDAMSAEQPNPLDSLCHCSVKLRQVEFIAENSDDDGDVDKVVLDLGGGTILELEP